MKKVLLIYDVDNWAWHHRAKDMQEFAPPSYEVTILPQAKARRLQRENVDHYDGIFQFQWTTSTLDRLLKNIRRRVALVTCNGLVYNHPDPANWDTWGTTPSRSRKRAKGRLPLFGGVVVVNGVLYDSVAGHLVPEDRVRLIPSGVNTRLWSPSGSRTEGERFTVGWCANPRAGGKSVKGLEEVLRPLQVRMGTEVAWSLNDRNHQNALTRLQMRAWYHTLDAFVCTSIQEGTPSPLFEAMACGIPVVTTDVGMVPDFQWPTIDLMRENHITHERPFGDYLEQMMVVPAYSNAEEAAEVVSYLHRSLDYLQEIGHAGRQAVGRSLRAAVVEQLDYRKIAPAYLRFIVGEEE